MWGSYAYNLLSKINIMVLCGASYLRKYKKQKIGFGYLCLF